MLPHLSRAALAAGFVLTASFALAQTHASTPANTAAMWTNTPAPQPSSPPLNAAPSIPPADTGAPLPGDEALAHNPVPPGM